MGSYDFMVSGGLNVVDLVPGGAHGTMLKSCVFLSTLYANNWWWIREMRSIFIESYAWGTMQSHNRDGKFSSNVMRPSIM